MGYYADGEATITGPADSEIIAALGMDALRAQMAAVHATLYDAPSHDSLIARLLHSARFEVYNITEDPDGTITYSVSFHDKWFDATEIILRYLAEHGHTVTATFVGEDQSRWAYSTREGHLVEDALTDITVEAARQAAHDAAILADLRCATALDDTSLAARVRELLARPAPVA